MSGPEKCSVSRRTVSRRWMSILPLLLVAQLGCGGPVGKVSGKVTNQGQAVPRATLVFTLENQPAEIFYGGAGDDGKYMVDAGAKRGLPPGKYQVLVTDYVQADGTPLPGGEAGVSLRNSEQAVARQHSLMKEVAAGSNEIEIKLEEGQVVAPPPR